MTDTHDPMCPSRTVPELCRCGLIAQVRADERRPVRPDIFDVMRGTCGHVWLAESGKECPVCFEIRNKVAALTVSHGAALTAARIDQRRTTAKEIAEYVAAMHVRGDLLCCTNRADRHHALRAIAAEARRIGGLE